MNRRGEKQLFPHLVREPRNHQLFIIVPARMASLSAAGSRAMGMTSDGPCGGI